MGCRWVFAPARSLCGLTLFSLHRSKPWYRDRASEHIPVRAVALLMIWCIVEHIDYLTQGSR